MERDSPPRDWEGRQYRPQTFDFESTKNRQVRIQHGCCMDSNHLAQNPFHVEEEGSLYPNQDRTCYKYHLWRDERGNKWINKIVPVRNRWDSRCDWGCGFRWSDAPESDWDSTLAESSPCWVSSSVAIGIAKLFTSSLPASMEGVSWYSGGLSSSSALNSLYSSTLYREWGELKIK